MKNRYLAKLKPEVLPILQFEQTKQEKITKKFCKTHNISLEQFNVEMQNLNPELLVKFNRFYKKESLKFSKDKPKDILFTREKIRGIPVDWIYQEKRTKRSKLILYLHGGGFICGSIDNSWPIPTKFVQMLNIPAINVEYSLSPEHPFPTPLKEITNVYLNLIESRKWQPEEIIFMGLSTGGGLALSMLHYLKAQEIPLPKAVILFSPWTNLTNSSDSVYQNINYDVSLNKDILDVMAEIYSQGQKLTHPLISPLYGDYNGFPPLWIEVGEYEVLRDDAFYAAEKAKKQNVECVYKERQGLIHGYHKYFDQIPTVENAFHEVANFLKNL